MTDETTQAAPAIPESFSSPDEAARFWTQARSEQPAQEQNSSVESAEPATAETESADEADTAQPEEAATSETQDDAPDESPPRELPRSWSKDKAELWSKLDADTQDYLLEHDKRSSAEVRRVQNEAAEKLKGLTAREQAAEQARQAHEARANEAMNVLLREQVRDFPDIRSMEDVTKLAQTDPLRYIQWQAHQQELQAQASVVQEANQRSTQERQNHRVSYMTAQDAALKKAIPEFSNAAKLTDARERALPLLAEYGLSAEQLAKWADTDAGFEILQHSGFQHLIADLMKARDGDAARQKAAKAPVNKAVPPVMRPGSRQPAGNSALQEATKVFNHNPTPANAAKLALARRAASSRN